MPVLFNMNTNLNSWQTHPRDDLEAIASGISTIEHDEVFNEDNK